MRVTGVRQRSGCQFETSKDDSWQKVTRKPHGLFHSQGTIDASQRSDRSRPPQDTKLGGILQPGAAISAAEKVPAAPDLDCRRKRKIGPPGSVISEARGLRTFPIFHGTEVACRPATYRWGKRHPSWRIGPKELNYRSRPPPSQNHAFTVPNRLFSLV